ncbi:hypothetical protein PVL30_001895 [Lodderomyces elongisporus]|uniref:uncharacterized protein n=1 Tax=Lodderomyces elongisporus TaxID=36914 RepID=UPI0029263FFB|nr:uncharacterized protein PVL30_001895 [Lodderomyces elongisporus]WLF78168.1 hypothetical protein PVL30_001895 [Lodderomyces elongisporus]
MITKQSTDKLLRTFKAIEHVLQLHFATSVTNPSLVKILQQATELLGRKVEVKEVQQILTVVSAYSLPIVDGDLTIKLEEIGQNRIAVFGDKVQLYVESHPEQSGFPQLELSKVTTQSSTPSSSPQKVVKPTKFQSANTSPSKSRSPTKIGRFDDLKNARSKFQFTEKDAKVESAKSDGLSLLERIRLKEQRNANLKNSAMSPEMKYQQYLFGKIHVVYDAVYHLLGEQSELEQKSQRTFAMSQVEQIVMDTLDHPMGKNEIYDTIKLLAQKLSKFVVVEKNDVRILKVSNLNREVDLAQFK